MQLTNVDQATIDRAVELHGQRRRAREHIVEQDAKGPPIGLEAMARAAGSRCGVRYAESYTIRQAQLVSDPITELQLAPGDLVHVSPRQMRVFVQEESA